MRCIEKLPKYWVFGGLASVVVFLAYVLAAMKARFVDVEATFVVLLIVWVQEHLL